MILEWLLRRMQKCFTMTASLLQCLMVMYIITYSLSLAVTLLLVVAYLLLRVEKKGEKRQKQRS